MFEVFSKAFGIKDLKRKLLFTFLSICRYACKIKRRFCNEKPQKRLREYGSKNYYTLFVFLNLAIPMTDEIMAIASLAMPPTASLSTL